MTMPKLTRNPQVLMKQSSREVVIHIRILVKSLQLGDGTNWF